MIIIIIIIIIVIIIIIINMKLKKILPDYKKWKTQSKIKPIKLGERLGTTYCLGCKDYAHTFRLQEVKMTNKVLREKSNCVVCRSNKSRFLKQNKK